MGKLWLACVVAMLLLARAAHAEGFTGNFIGTDSAAAMSLSLQEAGTRVVGRLSLPDGRVYSLNGQRRETGVEGTLRISGAADSAALFQIEQQPTGLRLLFIPAMADGRPAMANARVFPFIPEGISVLPQSKLPAPAPAPAPARWPGGRTGAPARGGCVRSMVRDGPAQFFVPRNRKTPAPGMRDG